MPNIQNRANTKTTGNHIDCLPSKIIHIKFLLFKLFFEFPTRPKYHYFSCCFRIILIRFFFLFLWFQNWCTQIVPKPYLICYIAINSAAVIILGLVTPDSKKSLSPVNNTSTLALRAARRIGRSATSLM